MNSVNIVNIRVFIYENLLSIAAGGIVTRCIVLARPYLECLRDSFHR